ncbi:MAG: ATP-binding cassette domain-containing protein, partial [Brasilonema sp.]
SSGDRIVIAGANGSGKSSLAKAILGMLASTESASTPQTRSLGLDKQSPPARTSLKPAQAGFACVAATSSRPVQNLGMENITAILESGEILLAPAMKAVYLDQTYELVNRQQTILENMQAANPNLNYQLLRQQLGHFLFKEDDVNKSASVLSGGELARLAIAIISISQIDLLILDEPTNNLDIETVNQMIEGINEYQAALWVISHDLDFLSRINITQAYKLSEQELQQTTYLPSESEQYYEELLGCQDG